MFINKKLPVLAAIAIGFALWFPMGATSTPVTIFSDHFDGTGTADSAKWKIPYWTGPTDGTYVGRTQFRCSQNSSLPTVSNSNVNITLQSYNPTGFSFYGYDLISNRTFTPGNGLNIKFRAKSNGVSPGTVGGLFLYALKPGSNTLHDEIDFEIIGNDPSRIHTNVYANEPLGAGHPSAHTYEAGTIADYHTYEINWLGDKVEWLVDGKSIRTEAGHVPTDPMYLHLNMWAPASDWFEAYSASIQPTSNPSANQVFSMLVDSVGVIEEQVITNTPPTITLNSPTVNGNTATITGSAQATTPGATIDHIAWDWGDGSATENSQFPASHTYSASGTYTVTATATDSNSLTKSASTGVTIDPVKTPPTITLNLATVSGNTATITGSAQTTTPGATISSIVWNWGDGSNITSSQFPALHTYSNSGTYTVTATATDSNGLSKSASINVTIPPINTPPTMTLNPATVNGNTATITGHAEATTPGATINRIHVDWGDGSFNSDTHFPASHIYPDAGNYTITAWALDSNLVWSEPATTNVAIVPTITPPTISLNPATVNGNTVTVTGQVQATMPGVTITKVQVDWGLEWWNRDDITSFPVSHTYPNTGTYIITAWAVDSNGLWSQPATISVTILPTNTAPTINLNSAMIKGKTITIDGQAAATTPGVTISHINWNWGDEILVEQTTGFPASHTYQIPGTYTVTAWATDSNGLQSDNAVMIVKIEKTTPTLSFNTVTPSLVTYPGTVTLSGKLTANDGTALASKNVSIQSKGTDGVWRSFATVLTDASGTFSYKVKPSRNIYYRTYFAEDAAYNSVISTAKLAKVRPYVGISVKYPKIKAGLSDLMRFSTNPKHAGSYISIQKKSGTSWVTIARVKLDSNGYGSYYFRTSRKGTYYLRAVLPKHSDHETGTSKYVTIKVY